MANRTTFPDWIIHEDPNLLVVNKPAGISSLDDRSSPEPSMLSLARKYIASAQLCHRLDRETSGVILIAKNAETYREIAILFEKRKVSKLYHAVCSCPTNFDNTTVKLPIRETKKAVVVIDHAGKMAETVFTTLENFRHHSLVQCSPLTGRMHQIRIHLASQNASIAGDTMYGGKLTLMSELKRKYKNSKYEEERPMFRRVALHARSIAFTLLEEERFFEAPYPDDMEVFLKLLRKYDKV